MRIAVVADIHGNVRALEAVIADLATHSPDVVVNLGDHLSGPLEAARTADLLLAQSAWVHIRGNHDRQLLDGAPDRMGPSDRAAWAQIDDAHKAWLRALSTTAIVDGDILLCHGTPADDLEYLLEDITPHGVALASIDQVRARLATPAAATLCGHTHVPRLLRIPDSGIVFNPGSVGLQAYDDLGHRTPHYIENGSPHARYALLDREQGRWRATFRALEYDWDAASRVAADGGRAEWAYALATGYALRV